MKKIFLLYAFCCGSFLLFSQKEEKQVFRKASWAVAKNAIEQKNVVLLDDFLEKDTLMVAQNYPFVTGLKARTLQKIHKDALKHYTPADKQTGIIVDEIMQLYKKCIDTCEKTSLGYSVERVNFLEKIDAKSTELYQSDLKKLKAAGFKQNRQGIDLFVQYSRGENNWIGGGVSLVKLHNPYYRLKQINVKTGKKELIRKKMPRAMSLFSIAYNYDWQNRTSDMNFSLLQFEAPFYVNLTKIGKMENAKFKQSVWYYRPEIGFGTGNIALYYGYNMKFKKSNPAEINKHLITLKVSSIVGKK